jgi:hypothetical protein
MKFTTERTPLGDITFRCSDCHEIICGWACSNAWCKCYRNMFIYSEEDTRKLQFIAALDRLDHETRGLETEGEVEES